MAVIPRVEAAIRAEATTNLADVVDVHEVKVRGERGVPIGAPFFYAIASKISPASPIDSCSKINFRQGRPDGVGWGRLRAGIVDTPSPPFFVKSLESSR